MGKSAPSGPDMTPIYEAMTRQSQVQEALAGENLDFMMKQFDWSKGITEKILKRQLPAIKKQFGIASKNWNVYKRNMFPLLSEMKKLTKRLRKSGTIEEIAEFNLEATRNFFNLSQKLVDDYHAMEPYEKRFLEMVDKYAAPGYEDLHAGERVADVTGAIEAEERATEREMAAMGIDPSSGAYAALQRKADIGGAAAKVSAAWAGRREAEDRAAAYTQAAIGMRDAKLPMAIQLAGTGAQQGAATIASERQGITDLQALASMYAPLQGHSLAGFAGSTNTAGASANMASNLTNQARLPYGTTSNIVGNATDASYKQGNLMQKEYSNDIAAYQAQTAAMQGPMSLISGMAGKVMGMGFAAEGGAVPDLGTDPTDRADTIPAQLSENEYVIPSSVVIRKGTEFFDKLVAKATEEPKREVQIQQVATAADGGVVPPNPGAMVSPQPHPGAVEAPPGRHPMGYEWDPSMPLNTPVAPPPSPFAMAANGGAVPEFINPAVLAEHAPYQAAMV